MAANLVREHTLSETASLHGGCFCGAIRYVAAEVFDAGYCHCTICRRFCGAAAACWLNVREEHFSLTCGEPVAFRSSQHFTRFFCRHCGTHLYGTDDRPAPPKVGSRLVSIMLGTLDEPQSVRPKVHQWWADRMPWYAEAMGLPTFDGGTISHPATRAS